MGQSSVTVEEYETAKAMVGVSAEASCGWLADMSSKMDGLQEVGESASEETLNWPDLIFHEAVNLVLKAGRQSKNHDQAFFEGVWEDIRDARAKSRLSNG